MAFGAGLLGEGAVWTKHALDAQILDVRICFFNLQPVERRKAGNADPDFLRRLGTVLDSVGALYAPTLCAAYQCRYGCL